MRSGIYVLASFGIIGMAGATGGTVTFAPVGSTTVGPGENVRFDIIVTTQVLQGFDAADVVVGTPDAGDMAFEFSPEWDAAFLNLTGPVNNVGFYPRDVFVGGNNPTAVGASLRIGTLTVGTTGLGSGTYSLEVSSVTDGGISKLSRGDLRDLLTGSTTFIVACAAADVDCDGDVDLVDFRDLYQCVSGPGVMVATSCIHYDTDADQDVDLMDAQQHMLRFTGIRK